MASPLLLAEQRVALDSIARLAQQDLLDLWGGVDTSDARAATRLLLAEVPTLTTAYGDMAATLSADLYEEFRSESGVRSLFRPSPANPVPIDQAQALVRWGVEPLWSSTPNPAAALQKISGGLTRLTLHPAGDTVVDAAGKDPERPRYARTTHPGACHFCLMLASRGAVFHGDAPYFESHDYCRCSAVPVFDGDAIPEDNARLAEEWQRVTGRLSNDEARAAWRQHVDSMSESQRGSLLGPQLAA